MFLDKILQWLVLKLGKNNGRKLNELSGTFSAKRCGMASKKRRVVAELRRSTSSSLVNFETNRTVAKRFTSFAYSSFVSKERGEGSFVLDFFATFLIKQESLNKKIT
ncbi:MAG: hypothetical protein JXR36_17250 [Bacteroidales bacterium]|nr:hypothetical protein [Bacteroidales bacterium]